MKPNSLQGPCAGRICLVLTLRTSHVDAICEALDRAGHHAHVLDEHVTVLARMHTKRLPAYKTLGFNTPTTLHHQPGTPTMPSDPDHESIDAIIERVTVDAYGDEGHISFLCAFEDEVDYPLTASLAGTPVVVRRVADNSNPTRGLVASITNETGTHQIALTELDLEPSHARQLLAAYRRWLGLDR